MGDITRNSHEAKSLPDPREQARTLQEALRDVFSIEEQAPTTEFLQLKNTIVKLLSADDERSFIAQTKQTLADAQTANEAATTGPADITQEIQRLEGNGAPVRAVAFHPDGKRVLGAAGDEVLIWNLETGERKALGSESMSVRAVAFSSDGKHAFGGNASESNSVYVWDVETGSLLYTLSGTGKHVSYLAVSSDNRLLLSAESRGTTNLWNLEQKQPIGELSGEVENPAVAFSLDSRLIVYRNRHDIFWQDPESGKIIGKATAFGLDYSKIVPPTKTGILPFGELSRTETNDTTIFLLEGQTLMACNPTGGCEGPAGLSEKEDRVADFAISPDGYYAISGDAKGVVRLVQLNDRYKQPLTLGQHDRQQRPELIDPNCGSTNCNLAIVYSAAFSPDGSRAVSAGADGTIRVWGPKS